MNITTILAFLTLLAHIGIVLGIIVITVPTPFREQARAFFSQWALLGTFTVALIATLMSLYYSEIVGYAPCQLCWFERIFTYPLVILLGIAYIKNDRNILPYALGLIIPGTLIALYHNALYAFPNLEAPCSNSLFSVSCTADYFTAFGYITIPMMALTSFLIMGGLVGSALLYKNRNESR